MFGSPQAVYLSNLHSRSTAELVCNYVCHSILTSRMPRYAKYFFVKEISHFFPRSSKRNEGAKKVKLQLQKQVTLQKDMFSKRKLLLLLNKTIVITLIVNTDDLQISLSYLFKLLQSMMSHQLTLDFAKCNVNFNRKPSTFLLQKQES